MYRNQTSKAAEFQFQFQLFENFTMQSSVYRFCFRFPGINKLLPSSVLALLQMFNIVRSPDIVE